MTGSEIAALVSALPNVGLAVLLVILTVWGIWKILIPAVIKRWNEESDQRYKREQATQQYYIDEIKSLRDESRNDKSMLFDAFRQNTEINTRLNQTLSEIQEQLSRNTKEIVELRTDVHAVYHILGEKRGVIQKDT